MSSLTPAPLTAWAENLEKNESLDRVVARVRPFGDWFVAEPARRDLLRGAWLGHAVHPTITDVPPLNMPAMAHPEPPMWNSGMATMLTMSSLNPHVSLASGSRANRLSLESITPLGRPVVPEEYSWNATSEPLGSTPGSDSSSPIHAS